MLVRRVDGLLKRRAGFVPLAVGFLALADEVPGEGFGDAFRLRQAVDKLLLGYAIEIIRGGPLILAGVLERSLAERLSELLFGGFLLPVLKSATPSDLK